MVGFRVAAPHAVLAALRADGCNVEGRTEASEQGRFGRVIDPEGNKGRTPGAAGQPPAA